MTTEKTEKKKTGRPDKMTRELIESVSKYVSAGNSLEDSAVLSGICAMTLYRYRDRGEREKKAGLNTLFSEFSDAIKKAESACKHRNIVVIQKASIKHWQAAAWWLERKYKKEFGRLETLEHQGGVKVESLKEAEKKRIAYELAGLVRKK